MNLRVVVGACALLVASPVLAQSSGGPIVVSVNGINCSTLANNPGFDALTFSLGGTDKTSATGGAGKTSSVPTLDTLNVSKKFDTCSEGLIKMFLSGTVGPTLTLTEFKLQGEKQIPSLTITLSNAFITNYEVAGSTGLDPMETLSFTYTKVCVSSSGQNPDGSSKAAVKVCYDTRTRQTS